MSRIPLGFRFAPTDEELLTQFLRRQIKGESLPCDGVILERDIYSNAPWDVFKDEDPWHTFKTNPNKWEHVIYVFTKLKKIGGKKRIIRIAGCGTWDAQTGNEKIYNQQKEYIGFKKMLIFEAKFKKDECSIMPPGHWIMHEYSLAGVSLDGLEDDLDYVVCKIKRDDSKCLKRAPKDHKGGHGGAIDQESTKTSQQDTYPTRKKMRYEASTTDPENFDVSMPASTTDPKNLDVSMPQEYDCLYDQTVINGHQFLPMQQIQFYEASTPENLDANSMQECLCLYDQSMTMGHEMLPLQQAPCSSVTMGHQLLPSQQIQFYEASTLENFDFSMQEHPHLYDQFVTMGHELLPMQQTPCSSLTMGHQLLPTQQQLQFYEASTSENFDFSMQEHPYLYDQSVIMGHQLLPMQQTPCSSVTMDHQSLPMQQSQSSSLPLLSNMEMESFLMENTDLANELVTENIDSEMEACINAYFESLMSDEPSLSVSNIQENV